MLKPAVGLTCTGAAELPPRRHHYFSTATSVACVTSLLECSLGSLLRFARGPGEEARADLAEVTSVDEPLQCRTDTLDLSPFGIGAPQGDRYLLGAKRAIRARYERHDANAHRTEFAPVVRASAPLRGNPIGPWRGCVRKGGACEALPVFRWPLTRLCGGRLLRGRGLLLRAGGASRVFEQRLNRTSGDGQVRQVLLQARHLTPQAIECLSDRAFFCVQTLEE